MTSNEIELLGTIPGLDIREKIGFGGMGSVYKSYQTALDRIVALKVVRSEFLTEKGLKLFYREAQVLAKIRHPQIVQIHESVAVAAVTYAQMLHYCARYGEAEPFFRVDAQ